MSEDLRKYCVDMLFAIDAIKSFIPPEATLQIYLNEPMLQAAIERKIAVIGEAMNNCLKLAPELPISNGRRIVNTRNKIIHAYDGIDARLIWDIATNHLPILEQELITLLECEQE
jgi:uncharacterized protein with HEPN domain